MEDGFTCHQHEVEQRSNGCAHDEVTSAADLDEGDDCEKQARDRPARVTPFERSKQQPEDSAFEQEEGKKIFQRNGLKSTLLGGGVGGEEKIGNENDDSAGEEQVKAKIFERGFEIGLLEPFDEKVWEQSYRGKRGEEETE